MAACSLYGAIVTALYRRQRTGEGGMVGTSLLANGLWSNGFMVQAALDGADMNVRLDGDKLSAFTRIYGCGDGRWFMLTILPQAEEGAWPRLARCVGHEEWLDDARFANPEQRQRHNVELADLFTAAFMARDWNDWRLRFAEFGITCGVIARAEDQCDDEQVQAAGMLVNFSDDSGRTVDSPLYVSGEVKPAPVPAPAVGEHSGEILAEFGVDEEALAALQRAGVVGT